METTRCLHSTCKSHTTQDYARRRHSSNTDQTLRLSPSTSYTRSIQSSKRTTNGTPPIYGKEIQRMAIGNQRSAAHKEGSSIGIWDHMVPQPSLRTRYHQPITQRTGSTSTTNHQSHTANPRIQPTPPTSGSIWKLKVRWTQSPPSLHQPRNATCHPVY